MSVRNQKSWERLRALISRVTLASVAVATPAAAAAARTPPVDEASRSLAIHLAHLPAIDAMGAAADLALSPDRIARQQLAHALAWSFQLPGDRTVIEHLARDPTPEVRAAAARAAWLRRTPDLDRTVLYRLLADDDPEVRAAAWLAVSR